MLAATGVWSFVLLNRTPEWWPAVRWAVLIGSIVVALVLALGAHRLGKATAVVAIAAAIFGLGGSAAFSIYNAASAHSGPGTMSGPQRPGGGFGDFGKGPGGPFGGGDNPQVEALLKGVHSRWAAASVGSFQVSSLELKTGASLMAIGGFTGGDPSPTLAQFQQYVSDGQVRYFLADSGHGGPFGHRTGPAADITAWVEKTFTKSDVGGTTVYDLQSKV